VVELGAKLVVFLPELVAFGFGSQIGALRNTLLKVNILVVPSSLVLRPSTRSGGLVAQLGRNAHGETLEPGRVPDCYLGLLLDPTDHDTQAACVLVVAPAALVHPQVPQPDGTVLYELVTGHPDRAAHELVFLPDLTLELRAWPADTWNKVGIDPQAAARAVVAARRPAGPAARRADRRGGPRPGAPSHDLGAGMAPGPARPPAQPG
jgi:hypothetical protein